MSIPTRPTPLTSPTAERYATLRSELADWVILGMKRNKVTGMSVALVDNGEVVWAQGFGYADKENKRLADAVTLYKAGSVSKVFTATAVMQLVEQGKVNLDVPIQTYIPELRPKYHFKVNTAITLRQIMSHRSGLISNRFEGMFTTHPKRYDTIIEYLNTVHHPYAPGTISVYSNLATDLQGIVIERVAGEQFEDYIEKHILNPLSMYSSTFSDARVDNALLSRAYRRNKEEVELPLRDLPAGNLYTSAIELSRFGNMVLNQGGSILKPQTLQQMLNPQFKDSELHDMGLNFGLNWILEYPRLKHLGKVAWHNGGTIHFMSSLVVFPEQGLSLVVLSNSALSMDWVHETVDKILNEAARLKSGITKPEPVPPVAETALPESLQQELPGQYATIVGALKLYPGGNGVNGKLTGLTVKLKYHEDGWISLHPRLFGFIPLPNKQLKDLRIKLQDMDEKSVLIAKDEGNILPAGVKVPPYSIPDAWSSKVGKYKLVIPEGDHQWFNHLTLIEKNDYLFAAIKFENLGKQMLIVRPISDDMGIIEGIGHGAQETIYLEQVEGNPAIRYDGYQFIKTN